MIKEQKKALRKVLKQKRSEIVGMQQKKLSDEAVFRKLVQCNDIIYADCVLCYISTDIEVDTVAFINYCFSIGKSVAVPKCTDAQMTFHIIKSFSDTEKGMYDITEPKSACPIFESESYKNAVCIVPGLAFDNEGFRLGYGKGYYDKFLSSFNGKSVGICYRDYIIENLPKDNFDLNVDTVITD